MDIKSIISKNYREITSSEWSFLLEKGIVNGCGGKGSFIKPPKRIFFKSSCNIHDLGYYVGGDENRRKECDLGFLNAMLIDSDKQGILKRYYKERAFLYYVAVRIFGKKYFTYK